MKRLLFAGIIFFSTTVTAQTKAGKADTVRHAVFYASIKPSATHFLNLSAKEQAAQSTTRNTHAAVVVTPVKKRIKNLQSKEVMKAALTGSSE